MVTTHKGEATTLILLAVVLLGGGAWGLSKTSWFSKRAKQAATSTATTATLEAAQVATNSKAAAVFTAIGTTNTEAPDSPQKRVIARFVPIGLTLTGEPDTTFLLELEKLKVAELSGKLSQANEMSAVLMSDASKARQELAKALAAKRASDLALEQAAAAEVAAEQASFKFMLLAIGAALLWAYTKLSHVSPGALATAVADIRSGSGESDPAIRALDSVTTPTQQLMTRGNVWLKSKLTKLLT